MVKVIIAVFAIMFYAAVSSTAYDKGFGDGYIEGIVSEQERRKDDGEKRKEKSA